jgi:hypothetical protein
VTRERLVLVAGVGIVATLLGGPGACAAYRNWTEEARERAQMARLRWELLKEVADTRTALRDSLVVANHRLGGLAPLLLDGSDAARASGALLSLVAAAGGRQGVRLGALQTGDSVLGGHFLRVGVRGTLTADVAGLMEFLAGIEASAPRLLVRELDVVAADPAASPMRAEELRVRFSIEALAPRRRGT